MPLYARSNTKKGPGRRHLNGGGRRAELEPAGSKLVRKAHRKQLAVKNPL